MQKKHKGTVLKTKPTRCPTYCLMKKQQWGMEPNQQSRNHSDKAVFQNRHTRSHTTL